MTTPRPNRLLIDGDIIAFVSAAAAQGVLIDQGGWHLPIANQVEGEIIAENMLASLCVGLDATVEQVVLSDPSDNWRWAVDISYKTNRTGPRPLLLTHLKQYLRDRHGATHWPSLEADDVLGIMATSPTVGAQEDASAGGRKRIVVGRDKDFKSIPGWHHSWKQDLDAAGRMVTRNVTRWEADRFHLVQSLAGDRVDGFPGCPGVGMERAAQIIDRPTRLVPNPGVKTRGVNKGDAVTRWMAEPTTDLWACIVSQYRKAGLGEAEALTTARLARILRHGEYNRETEEVTLWTPSMIAA